MCAFYRNLLRGAGIILLLLALPALAASPNADRNKSPTTGLEGGSRHSYGPDAEDGRSPRPTMPMPHDAYGNPIVPREPEQKKRHRPSPGAYGARGTQPERPLPDMPSGGSGWKFK